VTPPDPAASARAHLARLAREQQVELQLLLSEFAVERLLYRLGQSRYGSRYVLKGAMLFRLWSPARGRATWDLDLLGHGADGVEDVAAVIREVCRVPADDGIELDPESVRAEEIRPGEKYAGVRVRLVARLAGARIPMQVDVGFGDAVTPAPERRSYPTLLDHPAPEILVYPREAVVAEKLEAMVSLGVTNSRMKDFFDLHALSAGFAFDGRTLAEAIVATFARRGTPLPDEAPLALTPGFLADPAREVQWRAFLRRGRLDAPPDAENLASALRGFLVPVLEALSARRPFVSHWPAGGPWTAAAGHLGESRDG
jgi:predicted nucleotidyltransferase component of viral defense system